MSKNEKVCIARQPILYASGEGIAEAWENSLLKLWDKGVRIKTQHDRAGDPQSRDSTMIIVVKNSLAEPRIHLCFPAGLENLEIYRQEVVEGVHDAWINPSEGKWTYTYHERLFNYDFAGIKINQIEKIVDELSNAIFTRRAQAITWSPFDDPGSVDPPCLQRVWCRVFEDDYGRINLSMNTHWRSRDAYKAAFMNMFAVTDLQRIIAQQISKKTGIKILPGQYTDISDSYHVYGKDFEDFENRFLRPIVEKKREFYNPDRQKSRTLRSDDEVVKESFEQGRKMLELEKETGIKGKYS